MNISLRKASVIQNRIIEAIRDIKIETTVQLNEFLNPETVISQANETLFKNDERRRNLLISLYNIRGLVGMANSSAGIDLALAKAAFVDKRLTQLTDLAQAKVTDSIVVINGRLSKLKEIDSSGHSYGRLDTIQTSVINSTQLDNIKREISNLKKQKQKLNDEILELNIKTEIPLSEETVKLLTDEELI